MSSEVAEPMFLNAQKRFLRFFGPCGVPQIRGVSQMGLARFVVISGKAQTGRHQWRAEGRGAWALGEGVARGLRARTQVEGADREFRARAQIEASERGF